MIRLFVLSVLYFPGTLLHEFSHYLFAKLLGVPVFGFSVVPKVINHGLEFGHVRIQRVDIVRRGIIAVAPFVVGVICLIALTLLILREDISSIGKVSIGYFILCVLNMMIPSKEDLLIARPAIIGTLFIVVLGIILFLLRSLGIWH